MPPSDRDSFGIEEKDTVIRMNELEKRLNIPYIKLKFCLVVTEDAVLPRDKVSALRGGMGEMLLRQNCINNRECQTCRYKSPCIVHKTLYTQMKKKPAFMQGDDSIGYLIECENYQERFKEGDGFFFYLVLFGDNIVYFGQYLQVFHQLGMEGIGKDAVRYVIHDIKNISGESLLREDQLIMSAYRPETVYDHVMRRMKEIEKRGCKKELVFHTPTCLKYQGKYISEFQTEAVFRSLFRRIMMLDYFVEIYMDQVVMEEYPAIVSQKSNMRVVKRYSSTQDSKVSLRGMVGEVRFEDISEEYLPYVLAGELLHIGKNTSFGFGRYSLN